MRTLTICIILASLLLTVTPALAQKSSITPEQRRQEYQERYNKLSTADKRRVDDITHKMRELNDERLRILGLERQSKPK